MLNSVNIYSSSCSLNLDGFVIIYTTAHESLLLTNKYSNIVKYYYYLK